MKLPKETDNRDGSIALRGRVSGLFFDRNSQNVATWLISATLIVTGPAIILLEAATNGGFTSQQSINWMFAVYFFWGLFGILMSLLYRMPITGGHSLTGVAFLSTVNGVLQRIDIVEAVLDLTHKTSSVPVGYICEILNQEFKG